MSKLSNTDRDKFRTGMHTQLPEGPALVTGKYIVWYNNKVVRDEKNKWRTFTTRMEAQTFYDLLRSRP